MLDVILDDSHPIFKTKININPTEWPDAANDKPADQNDKDYTWIGRVLVRPFSTHKNFSGVSKQNTELLPLFCFSLIMVYNEKRLLTVPFFLYTYIFFY